MVKRKIKYSKTLLDIRPIIRIGNARGVTLPTEWISENNLDVGDRVIIKVEATPKVKIDRSSKKK